MVARVTDDLRRLRESPESRQGLIDEARKELVAGLLLAVFGAGITAFTLLAALSGA